MVSSTKILTVSYGTFSCTAEGFEDPLAAVKDATHFFRSIVTEDRFFGAEPPQFDPDLASELMRRQIDGVSTNDTQSQGALTLRSPAFGTGAASSGALAAALAAGPSLAPGKMRAAAKVPAPAVPDTDLDPLPDDDTIDATAEIIERLDPETEAPELEGDDPDDSLDMTSGAGDAISFDDDHESDDDDFDLEATVDSLDDVDSIDDGDPETDDSISEPELTAQETVAEFTDLGETSFEDTDIAASAPVSAEPVPARSEPAGGSIAEKLARIRNVVARQARDDSTSEPIYDADIQEQSPDDPVLASVFGTADEDEDHDAISDDMSVATSTDSVLADEDHPRTGDTDPVAKHDEENSDDPDDDLIGLYDPEDQAILADTSVLAEAGADDGAEQGDTPVSATHMPPASPEEDVDFERLFADTLASLTSDGDVIEETDTVVTKVEADAIADLIEPDEADSDQPVKARVAAATPVESDADRLEAALRSANDAAWEGLMDRDDDAFLASGPKLEETDPEAESDDTDLSGMSFGDEPAQETSHEASPHEASPEVAEQDSAAEAAEETLDTEDDDWSALFADLDDTPKATQDSDADTQPEVESTAEAPEPEPSRSAGPLRARVIKVKRELFNKVVSAGQLEEVIAEEDAPKASISRTDEDDLERELAQIKAEFMDDSDGDRPDNDAAAGYTPVDSMDEVDFDSPLSDDEWPEAPLRLDNPVTAPEEATSVEDSSSDADSYLDDARKTVRMSSQARAMLTESEVEEDDANRLMALSDTEMREPEGNRRRSAIAHLRAAVAATRADKQLMRRDDAGESEPYRRDLETVVRPRRPQAAGQVGAGRHERPDAVTARPAPLTLVAEQRVAGGEEAAPVRPRRVRVTEEAEDQSMASGQSGFIAYAEEMGATELSDLLEAAASYMSFVEERDQFSRPQLMTIVRQAEGNESSREDRLRSFGKLLREGKIEKTSGGRFTASDRIGFQPDARAFG